GHHAHRAPVDAADARHDAVGRQVGSHGVGEEAILDEGVLVAQQRDALADEELVLAGELLGLLGEVAGPGSFRDLVEIVHPRPPPAYPDRRRPRTFSGTAPKPRSSRSLRSRYRTYCGGRSRLANSVNVGGSAAPCSAYSTRAPPGAGCAACASAITLFTSRVG